MSSKIEYLEKYSVAPSPSRDYYGLKVLRDEVVLYLWKISHGPHKTPVVRSVRFIDFEQSKSLQDEIRRGFGERILKHVKDIVRGEKRTLLTLPKCLIDKLVNYLTAKDIVKLASVSHVANEIFNDNSVWEILYKRHKPVNNKRREEHYIGTCNWKQLFKLEQMQALMNEQKNSRIRPATKVIKTKSTKEGPTRLLASPAPKPVEKIPPFVNPTIKKPLDITRRKTNQGPVSKKFSDNHLDVVSVENEKPKPDKKVPIIKSIQTIGQKNIKLLKGQSITSKIEPKREVENTDSISINKSTIPKPMRVQNKMQKPTVASKPSTTSIRTNDSKTNLAKSKSSTASKLVKPEKFDSRPVQNIPVRPKTKTKPRKISQSKSSILSTDKILMKDSAAVRDTSFDLADLIEASLKNIRSPRSIFDYDFSCFESTKPCAGDGKTHDEIRKIAEISKGTKVTRPRAILDRLSEKSEPLTAKSTESVKETDVSDASFFVAKQTKSRIDKTKKSVVLNKNQCSSTTPDDKTSNYERYGLYTKFPTPRITDPVGSTEFTPRKKLDKMDVLRSLGSNNLTSGPISGLRRNVRSATGNRFE